MTTVKSLLTLSSGALLLLSLPASRVCAETPVSASSAQVYASGLNGPRGLVFGPDGTLYIAEAGAGGTDSTIGTCTQSAPPVGPYSGGLTATISQVSPSGEKTILAKGFPSAVGGNGDYLGVSDVAFLDGTLYALLSGGGCSHGNPEVPNGIVKVNLKNGKWTEITDLSTFVREHPVAYPNVPAIDPDGDPYSLLAFNGRLFSVEPNHGQVLVTTTDGHTSRVVDVSLAEGHSVPTSIASANGNLYVGNLGPFPIDPQQEQILTLSKDLAFVDTTPGLETKPAELNKFRIANAHAGFTTVLSVKFGPDGLLYALEFTAAAGYPAPDLGKVVRLDRNGTVEDVVTGLSLPTGMTFGPDNALYISNLGAAAPGAGQILRVALTY